MVFLSHQASDAKVAEALVELLTRTLALRPSEIRCTTPSRSKLPVGSEVLPTLAQEVVGAPVFLCLVTKNAARSRFVRFEIETRWKSGKSMFPVLGLAAQPKLIPEIAGLTALKCDNRHDLAQLVREIAKELRREPEPLEFITAAIDSALKVTAPDPGPRSMARPGLPLLVGAAVVLGMSVIYAGLGLLESPRADHTDHADYTDSSPPWPITEDHSPGLTTDVKPAHLPAPRTAERDENQAQLQRTTPSSFRVEQRSTVEQGGVSSGLWVQVGPASPRRGEEPPAPRVEESPAPRVAEMALPRSSSHTPEVTGIAIANDPPCLSGGCGSIKGTVSYMGAPVKPEMLKRKGDAFCAKKDFPDETVLLSKDGKSLANVLVRVKNAPPAATVPAEPVVVDQVDCMYRPRVQGAVEGQKVQIKNSDGTMHNVHAYAGAKTLFNTPQRPRGAPIEKDAKSTDVMKLQCDVHPWMRGYVVFSKSPLFGVSGADGTFEIKDVPPGQYTVEAWHERFGIQTAEVTVQKGSSADPGLAFAGE